MGRTHVEEVNGGLCPVGGNPWWNGMSAKILPLRRKDQKRQCMTKLLQLLFPFALHGSRRNDDLLLSLSQHMSLLLHFSSTIQMRRAVPEWLGWAPVVQSRSNHHITRPSLLYI